MRKVPLARLFEVKGAAVAQEVWNGNWKVAGSIPSSAYSSSHECHGVRLATNSPDERAGSCHAWLTLPSVYECVAECEVKLCEVI